MKSVILASLAAFAFGVSAQTFPGKPLRIVVPYPPGGGVDILARQVGQRLTENLGQAVIVENKPGANEIIGTDVVAKAVPDGHTLGLVSSTFSTNLTLNPKLPYRPDSDLVPIAVIGVPMVALVPASSPIHDLASLVAAAKARPGVLNYASLGPTSLQAISTEWFKHVAGVDLREVGYKGAAPALAALAVDEVQFMFAGVGTSTSMLQAGRVRAIGVTAPQRVALLPSVPPIVSLYPRFELSTWYAFIAPAGTAPSTVQRLSEEIGKVLAHPEVAERLASQGAEPIRMSQSQLTEFLKKDAAMWAAMIKAANIKTN